MTLTLSTSCTTRKTGAQSTRLACDAEPSARSTWVTALLDFTRGVASGHSSLNLLLQKLLVTILSDHSPRLVGEVTSKTQESPSHRARDPMSATLLRRLTCRAVVLSLCCDEAAREAAVLVRAAESNGSLSAQSSCDVIVTERAAVRRAKQLASSGRWHDAIEVLQGAVTSDIGLAAGVDVLCVGLQWEAALGWLALMHRASWSDREIAVVLNVMYKQRQKLLDNQSLWRQAVTLMSTYCEASLRTPLFSSPAAVSNLLGILAYAKRWRLALHVAQQFLSGMPGALNSPYGDERQRVRPNMMTVGQLMFALRAHWQLGLHVASQLVKSKTIDVNDIDVGAAQRILAMCIRGSRWAEAARLLQGASAHKWTVDTSFAKTLVALMAESGQASTAARFASVHLQRHSNHDSASRAVNALVQSSRNIAEAEIWLLQLPQNETASESSVARGLEDESIAHLAELFAKAGNWRRAAIMCNELMAPPRCLNVAAITPQLHDSVQFALASAPLPGPTWEVGMKLFSMMCALHVPLSEVAFQSVAKKCFLAGATTQANQLFAFTMKRGVGRR